MELPENKQISYQMPVAPASVDPVAERDTAAGRAAGRGSTAAEDRGAADRSQPLGAANDAGERR